MFESFAKKYYSLSELPLQRLTESTLNSTFIIDFDHFKELSKYVKDVNDLYLVKKDTK